MDADFKLVFVNKNISYEEKVIVLAHEEGHIACGHIRYASENSVSVLQESEANQFAHYLLYPTKTDFIKMQIIFHKKQIIIALLICLVATVAVFNLEKDKDTHYYQKYYVTENGKRYHKQECMIIKNKKNVRRMTISEFEKGTYTPCQVCLPN